MGLFDVLFVNCLILTLAGMGVGKLYAFKIQEKPVRKVFKIKALCDIGGKVFRFFFSHSAVYFTL
jgi:hypothetical protein